MFGGEFRLLRRNKKVIKQEGCSLKEKKKEAQEGSGNFFEKKAKVLKQFERQKVEGNEEFQKNY